MIKRKKLEGFTLVEIIVALAVFMVMSLIVVMIFQITNAIIRDSQNTTTKANNHALIAHLVETSRESGYDKEVKDQRIKINGVSLGNVDVVTIEGAKPYDSSATNRDESPEGNFYENAPGIRVFTGDGTKTY